MNDLQGSTYMSDGEIIEFVKRYIEKSSYNFAVLIDGNWGSGKTFFIQNTLIPTLKKCEEEKASVDKDYKQKRILYISLYGINSKDELIRQISLELLPFLKSKTINVASSIGKVVLGGFLSSKGISLSELSIDISNLVSVENCILFFDDLERCSLNVNEALGFINNFVEHDGIKTIIVANEKEISTTTLMSNKELKYLVAACDQISFPEKEDQKNEQWTGFENRNNISPKVEVKELDARADFLFGEDFLYKQIKEKLIGVTIRYKPDIPQIIQHIAQNCFKDEQIRKKVLSNMCYIVEKLDHYDHSNFRTLYFCFDKFNLLIESIIQRIPFTRLEELELLDEMFKYTLVLAILYKTGRPLPKWDNDNEIDTVTLEKGFLNINNYIKGFRFVDSFILGASFDIDKVIEIITKHISSLKIQRVDPTDPLYRLNNGWWLMDDIEAADLLKDINKALVETPQKYNVLTYSSILSLNISLTRVGVISVDIDLVVHSMINNLNLFDIARTFDTFGWRSTSFEDKQDELTYKECIAKLYENVKIQQEKTCSKNLNSVFDHPSNWVKMLSKYVEENEGEIIEQKAFLSKIDLDQLILFLKGSTSLDVHHFREIIVSMVYKMSNVNEFYLSDKEVIDKLALELNVYINEIKNKQKLRSHNFHYLVNNLQSISERLTK